MRAYSLDLRERIVAAVAGGLSKAEAARRFSVDVSTVKRYARRGAAGALAPKRSPGRPRRIRPGDEAALGARVAAANDATLPERCRAWAAGGGAAVSAATMGRALARAGHVRRVQAEHEDVVELQALGPAERRDGHARRRVAAGLLLAQPGVGDRGDRAGELARRRLRPPAVVDGGDLAEASEGAPAPDGVGVGGE